MTAQNSNIISRIRFPLRFRFLLPVALFLLVSSIAVWSLSYFFTERTLTNFSTKLIQQSNIAIKEDLRTFMDIPKRIVEINRGIYLDAELPVEEPYTFRTIFFNQLKQYESVKAIEYSDEDKRDISVVRDVFETPYSVGISGPDTNYTYQLQSFTFDGDPIELIWELEDYDPTQLEWYVQGKENKTGSWTPLYFWPNGDLGLDYISPVFKEDEFHGVILTSYTIDSLTEHIKNLSPTENSKILLVEDSGIVIAGTDVEKPFTEIDGVQSRVLMKDLEVDIYRQIYNLLTEKYGSLDSLPSETVVQATINKENYLISASRFVDDMGLSWIVLTAIPESDYLAGVANATRLSSIVIVFLLAITTAFTVFLTRKIIRPVLGLSKASKEITSGNLDVTVDVSTNDELGDLTQNFNTMTSRIKDTIEEVKNKEEQATEERNKLNAVLHNMGDGVFVLNKDKEIVLINKEALKLTGFSLKECSDKPYGEILQFVFENDHSKTNTSFIDKAYETKQIQEMTNHTVLQRKDGSFVPVKDSASPLIDSKGNVVGCVVVFRDISEERKIDKAKDEFVSLASHQLRTPLTAIAWYTQLLTEKGMNLTKEQGEIAQNIQDGTERMASLINALLRVTNFELGKITTQKDKVSFAKTVENIKTRYANLIKERGIKININIPEELDTYVADEDFIYLLLENLITNAVKFSKENSEVNISLEKVGNDLLFEVEDFGIGIDKEYHDKVFSKLFRTERARNVDTMGVGLGLYLCKLIVDRLGGKIWFDSEQDKGSKFFVRLSGNNLASKL